MTPFLKVAHIRLAAVSGVEADLAVVHLVRDHGRDILRRSTSTNVLAIATTASRGVVGIDAAGSDLSRNGSHLITPGERRDRGIGTMNVVGVENALLVVG